MSKRIEKTINSKPHLDRYRELCRRHPWYSEGSELSKDWSAKVDAVREAGGDPIILFRDETEITVEDEIEFAKATLNQPDVLWYLEDFVERTKDNPDADPHPDFVEITGAFENWYFFKKGYPYIRNMMIGARAVLLKYLRGDIPSIDGPEAYKVAQQFRLKSKS